MMELTLEMEAEVKFCLDEYAEQLNKNTGNDFTTGEAAAIIIKQYLHEKGLLERWQPEK